MTNERTLDVLIIGAGIAGIGMAMRLKSDGVEDFAVLESQSQLGGTWRDNVYPGVACDVPAPLYSYEAMPDGPWNGLFATGAEVLEYLHASASESGVLPHIRFNTEALSMRWSEYDLLWEIEHSQGSLRARNLVLACGRLTEPAFPGIPGIESFPGEVLHSARWRDIDFTGQRVALVGTGASGVQLLPYLSQMAQSVVVFQRSPAYVLPRNNRLLTEVERSALSSGGSAARELREEFFERAESVHPQRVGQGDGQEQDAIAHLARVIRDPELLRHLTPLYPLGCKRVTFSDDYYPSFLLSSVTLEPSALSAIQGGQLSSALGQNHDIDVIVFATGFETTDQPFAARVFGRGAYNLAEHWANRMRSYASTVVHGFPNMFVLNGPNAGLSHNSAVYMIETQVEYVVQAIAYQRRAQLATLEVSAEAEIAYLHEIDARAEQGVWNQDLCSSWYLHKRTGAVNLLWPGTAAEFRQEYGDFQAEVFLTIPALPSPPQAQRSARPSELYTVG